MYRPLQNGVIKRIVLHNLTGSQIYSIPFACTPSLPAYDQWINCHRAFERFILAAQGPATRLYAKAGTSST